MIRRDRHLQNHSEWRGVRKRRLKRRCARADDAYRVVCRKPFFASARYARRSSASKLLATRIRFTPASYGRRRSSVGERRAILKQAWLYESPAVWPRDQLMPLQRPSPGLRARVDHHRALHAKSAMREDESFSELTLITRAAIFPLHRRHGAIGGGVVSHHSEGTRAG